MNRDKNKNADEPAIQDKWTPYNDILIPRSVPPIPLNNVTDTYGMSAGNVTHRMVMVNPIDTTINTLRRDVYGPFGPVGAYGTVGPYMNVASVNDMTGMSQLVSLDPLPRWEDYTMTNAPPYAKEKITFEGLS